MDKPENGLTTRVHYVGLTDGDTVIVELRRKIRIRVKDLLCAELRTPEGKVTKQYAQSLFKPDELLTLFIPSYGENLLDFVSFNRVVGILWMEDGRNYGDVIVEAKMGRYVNEFEQPREGI